MNIDQNAPVPEGKDIAWNRARVEWEAIGGTADDICEMADHGFGYAHTVFSRLQKSKLLDEAFAEAPTFANSRAAETETHQILAESNTPNCFVCGDKSVCRDPKSEDYFCEAHRKSGAAIMGHRRELSPELFQPITFANSRAAETKCPLCESADVASYDNGDLILCAQCAGEFTKCRRACETETVAKPACEKCGQPAACKLDRRWLCSSCGCAALEADDTPVEGIARLRVDDHPIPPLVKGGQGREVHCSPALAVLILIAAIALPVVVVLAILSR